MNLFDRKLKVVILTCVESYTITDLHMSFECEFSKDSKSLNSANVTIYNLSEATRHNIHDNYLAMEIHAGYDKNLVKIFTGRIIEVSNRKDRADWVTTINALDGGDSFFSTLYNKSWSTGAKIEDIVKDIVNTMGLPAEYGQSIITSTLFSGAAFSGKCKDVLDQVCKSYRLEWSIQRGVVVVTSKDFPPLSALSRIVILSADSGLIGNPIIAKEDDTSEGEKDKSVKPIGKVSFTSLLNPEIMPNRVIKFALTTPSNIVGQRIVDNKKGKSYKLTTDGMYIVSKAKYSGSNFENEFYVNGECDIYA
jgi:hypothetical protein